MQPGRVLELGTDWDWEGGWRWSLEVVVAAFVFPRYEGRGGGGHETLASA
jgi:hypothetical protein